MKKLAVFFPGIGYTVDKPLLYYSRKLARDAGYEIRLLPYGNFPEKIQGDSDRMKQSYEIALQQTREMIADLDFLDYDEVLLVGKSIGTIVAAKIAEENKDANIKMILYTPLEATLNFQIKNAYAFSGMNDPWVGGKDSQIPKLCHEKNIPCITFENANHSLETGDMETDLEYLKLAMKMTKRQLSI